MSNPSSLKTAFVATYKHGKGGRTMGFTSEYDALKDVGHGELPSADIPNITNMSSADWRLAQLADTT